MQAHSWETSEHAWGFGDPASGRMDGLGLLADLGGEDVDLGDMSPEEQADEFVAMLISLKSRNKLSAKDIALLFFWSSRGHTAMGKAQRYGDLGVSPARVITPAISTASRNHG